MQLGIVELGTHELGIVELGPRNSELATRNSGLSNSELGDRDLYSISFVLGTTMHH